MRTTCRFRVAVFLVRVSLLGVALVAYGAPDGSGVVSDGLPLQVFTTGDFAGAGVCASCHSWLTDSSGTDVSNGTHWRSTMMANGAIDPLWQAKVSSEIARNPSGNR